MVIQTKHCSKSKRGRNILTKNRQIGLVVFLVSWLAGCWLVGWWKVFDVWWWGRSRYCTTNTKSNQKTTTTKNSAGFTSANWVGWLCVPGGWRSRQWTGGAGSQTMPANFQRGFFFLLFWTNTFYYLGNSDKYIYQFGFFLLVQKKILQRKIIAGKKLLQRKHYCR